MPLSNTTSRYGAVTKTFHWLTALLIFSLIPLGLIANDMAYDTAQQLATKGLLFSLHKTLGVALFFVALMRITWSLAQPKPGLLHADRKLESWAAETAHWLLYGSLVLAPLSGWIHHASTAGFAPIWWPFGQDLPLVPKSESLAAATAGAHEVFVKVMGITILAHIGGALKHHILDRDATLRRMLPGRSDLPALPGARHSLLPPVSAVAIWIAALGLGAGLGMYQPHGKAAPAGQTLKNVASDWQVTDGRVGIAVTQFGSEVVGEFSDWTAAISFDETALVGTAGSVNATISIASLTLGSVTAQAMGPDFFDAATHPTATYAGEIRKAADGYEAIGDLTIKGVSMPLRLPFALTFTDTGATMLGRITLDRRSFGIGDTMADEKTLGFTVDALIELTATRPEE